MNYIILDFNNQIENDTKDLLHFLTPESFISILSILKSCQDFYSFNISSIDSIKFKFTQNTNSDNKLLFVTLNSDKDKCCILVNSDVKPNLVLNNEFNNTNYYNVFLQYSGLPLIFISLFTLFYQKFKNNRRYMNNLVEPILTSLGESITKLIVENKLDYLNIDTLPSFDTLCEQAYTVFSDYFTYTSPSSLSLAKKVDGMKIQNDLVEYMNKVLPTIQYTTESYKGIPSIYMYPFIKSTINSIYPYSTELLEKNDFESIFLYWLLGANVNVHTSLFKYFKLFQNQLKLRHKFETFSSKDNFERSQTWSLYQIKSIKNKELLTDVVGKFLFGKKRLAYQDKIIHNLIKDYSTQDDLTFYYECGKHYKPSFYDRSVARVKELDKLNVWDLIKGKTYLDFGGGDGQNAYAISQILGSKKGEVFVSDVQSWFGNENVQKYKDILTYRYLKTFLLPFDDNMFDFITVFQVLHHIRKYNLSIQECFRILKPGGILLIREHDCDSEETSTLIDIEHSLFEISGKSSDIDISYLQHYYAHYFNRIELYSLLESAGFKLIKDTDVLGPTRYYTSIWTK